MHLVNILRIITFSFLVGHSILTISDFNSFRVFWDTLYSQSIKIFSGNSLLVCFLCYAKVFSLSVFQACFIRRISVASNAIQTIDNAA
jgi:hypothetical protein